MLDPHDAQLCQRDRALPGLAALLDPVSIACILQDATPQAKLRQIKPTYLRYKPGEMCLAAYEVLAGDQRVLMHAIACNSRGLQKYGKLTGPGPVCSSPLPGHVVMRELGLVLNTFPNDRELKTLRRLFEPDRLARLLSRLDPLVNPADTTLEVLTYKPERRLVAKISTAGRTGGCSAFTARTTLPMCWRDPRRLTRAAFCASLACSVNRDGSMRLAWSTCRALRSLPV